MSILLPYSALRLAGSTAQVALRPASRNSQSKSDNGRSTITLVRSLFAITRRGRWRLRRASSNKKNQKSFEINRDKDRGYDPRLMGPSSVSRPHQHDGWIGTINENRPERSRSDGYHPLARHLRLISSSQCQVHIPSRITAFSAQIRDGKRSLLQSRNRFTAEQQSGSGSTSFHWPARMLVGIRSARQNVVEMKGSTSFHWPARMLVGI